MKKIVHIITALDTGGAQIALYRLLSGLSTGYQLQVISLTTVGVIGKRIQELGIPVESLGMSPGVPSSRAFFRLAGRLKELRPDIVHTWMYHADLIGGLAARLAGVPALAWAIRNSNLDADKTKRATRAVVRVCALLSRRLPDRIISCSRTARDIHVAAGYHEPRFVVIPNGFDLSCFRPDAAAYSGVRIELGIPADAPVIGIVGRFDPQKNHKGFIEAAGILHSARPKVHFVMVGEDVDHDNPQIALWMQHAGIKKVTHLLGLRDDIPRLTAALDVLASSSWGEAFPNVVGEAMACAVPCVVTDVGDSAYIVDDTGRVVSPWDTAALASAMEEVLSLPSAERKALGGRARARIVGHFELNDVVQRYRLLYDELAGIGIAKQALR